MTATEQLEQRTLLDASNPYGMGSMPGTGTGSSGTGTTGSTGTTGTGGTTTGNTGSTGSTTTGGTGGTTMMGSFLGSVNGGTLRPAGQEWFETFGTDPLSGIVAVHRDLPGGLSLSYQSDTVSRLPIVAVETTWGSASLPTGSLTATLKINGTTHSSVVLSHTGIQQGSALRIVLQATTPLPTGRYDAQIEVVAPVSGVNQVQTLSQTITVEDRSSSPFGQGWSLSELERVVPQTGGNLLVSGTGVREWFDSTGMPMPGMMSNSALVQQADMTWRLNLPDGGFRTYDTTGRITSKVDGYGNTISFGWNSSTGLLTSVTDAVGRATMLTYNNGRLSRVTDAAGRFVDLTHDTTGNLLTITDPVAAQPGTGTMPLMTYSYYTSGLIATLTDVQQRQTVLTYSFAGRLAQATLPGGALWQFAPVAAVGLVNTASGLGTTSNPAPVTSPTTAEATWTNPLGGIRKLKVDSLGNVIREVLPNGGTTIYTRDSSGRVLSVTQPDPDGTGPLPSPVTTSVYDTSGNRTLLTLPGGATRSWTYNSQNLPLNAVDELGFTTTYVWNSNRTLASVTLPNGATSTYTYNSRGQVTSQTLPDPDGSGPLITATTTFVYDTFGRKTQQFNPDGTSQSWNFNALDQVISATDTMGRVTFYDYRWTGQLSSVMLPDPDGFGPLQAPFVSYDYDSLGRQVTQSQNGTLKKSLAYNTAGRVASETLPDPDGSGPLTAATSVYSYDSLGRLIQTTMPGGAVRSVSYDAVGNVLSVTDPDPDGAGPQIAATTSFAYDALGRTTAVTDALGGVTSFLWNAAGYQIGTTNALGHSTSVTYDAAGRKTSTSNALGATTMYAYNSIGNVTSVTMPDPDGTGPLPAPVISSTYDLLGRTVSVTAPNGAVSSVQYDNMGRTIQQTAADGSYVTTVYNAGGQVTSQSQHAAGNTSVITSTLTYDALGRVLTATDPAGTSSLVYDANGNRSSATDASGRTTTFLYDAWSRPIQTTDGSGNQSKVSYNASGQIASTTDGLNHVTTFGYDLAGRRITSTDSNGGVTSTNYDRLGRTTKLTDPNGNITTWTFDAIGQLLTDSQNLAGSAAATRSYAYDPAGRLLSRTDRNGRTITFSYDHLGRQTQQNWLGSGGTSTNTITTTYNAAMNVASITDNDSALAFTWDSMGRLLSSSNAGTLNAPAVSLSQTFNTLGRRATEAATINGIADFLNTYTYDSAGRLSQVTQQDGNSSAGYVVTSKRVDLSYDAAGRYSGISRYQSLTTSQAVASSAYLYDAAGRLTSLQHTGMENGATASNPLAGYSFTWDSANRLTSVNSVKDGLVNYSYDSTGQVTGADFTGQTDESFTYDSNGNRTSVLPGSPDPAVAIGLHNRILNDGKFTYTYDAEGNRTAKTDNVSGSKVEYTWNHANLLTNVVYKTSNQVVTKSVAYQYDALGRRIGKSVDDNGNGTVDRRESYIYDGAGLLASAAGSIHISGPNGVMGQHGWGDQMVLSFFDADGDGSGAMTLASRNLYGNAVDQIFATESGSGEVFWALTDHQGTPRDWATRSASGTTTIAQHTRYTAFGAIESVTGSLPSTLAPLPSFTGQLLDPDTDLLYYRARWYDPQLGKFLSDDPMGFAAGDANVSRYVGNAGAVSVDPTGLDEYTGGEPLLPNGILLSVGNAYYRSVEEEMRLLEKKNILYIYSTTGLDPSIPKQLTEITRLNELAKDFKYSCNVKDFKDMELQMRFHVEKYGLVDRLVLVGHGMHGTDLNNRIFMLGGTEEIGDPMLFKMLRGMMSEEGRIVFGACCLANDAEYCRLVAEAANCEVVAPTGDVVIVGPRFRDPGMLINLGTEGVWTLTPSPAN